jgi:hypothetical protein
MRNQTTSRLPITILIIIVVWIVGIITFSLLHKDDSDHARLLNNVQKQYTELHKFEDSWIIPRVPEPNFYDKAADVAWKWGEEIKQNLSQYEGVNETTSSIWKTLNDFIPTLQINKGQFPENLATIARPAAGFIPVKGHEIAFLPRELLLKHSTLGVALGWRVDDQCISLAAIDWPKKFLAGALYHELLHGQRALSDSRSRFKQLNEREIALEEMQAHRVEADVLNATSEGEYFKLFDEIENRGIFVKGLKGLVATMTLDDMKKFDVMFGLEKSGPLVTMFSYSQYIQGLAVYHMDKRGTSDKEKAEFFLWLKKSGVMSH